MMIYTENILRQESGLTVLFEALKTYLMLSSPERLDKEFVRRFYMYWWDKQFSATMSSEQLFELGGHLDALMAKEMALPFSADDNLVMTVRGALMRQTIYDFLYANIMGDAYRDREGKGFTVNEKASSRVCQDEI